MPHRPSQPVWVVRRADLFLDPSDTPLEFRVTAKEVGRSQELAEREVERLNALRDDPSIRYLCQMSRLFAAGESAGTADTES